MSKGDVLKIPVALEVNSAAFSSCLVCYVWGLYSYMYKQLCLDLDLYILAYNCTCRL